MPTGYAVLLQPHIGWLILTNGLETFSTRNFKIIEILVFMYSMLKSLSDLNVKIKISFTIFWSKRPRSVVLNVFLLFLRNKPQDT